MDDPFFEATISAVRGFDLGDDGELLHALCAPDAELSADDWLLRGVLEVRAGRNERGLVALDQAAAMKHPTAMSSVHYLRARLLSRIGRTAASGEALDAAERAAHTDRRVPEAAIAHARALAEWEAGRPSDALVHVGHGLSLDPTSAARWRDKGILYLELSRPSEAIEALDHALRLQSDDDTAMVLHAIADAELGQVETAAQWLDQALRVAPARREALAHEPRLAGVRKHPEIARLLEPPAPPSVGWMDELAGWVSALRYAMRRPAHQQRHPIRWLGRAEAEREHARMLREHERGPLGTMHSAATLAHAREVLGQRVIIGRGPGTPTREGVQERCLIALDPSPHGELWVALSDVYPAFLWLPAGRDAASLCAVLDEYFPRPRRTRADLTARARGFIGYRERIVAPNPITGHLEPAGEVELDRHFTLNPFVESGSWGSAFTDDPWPDDIPSQPGVVVKIERRRRKLSEQARGAVWSMTRRLRHSRGYLSVERHHGEIFVADVRYRPSAHRETTRAVNAHFGTDYPEDLPVDALAALLGFSFDSALDLETALARADDEGESEEAAGLLMVIAALRHSDLEAHALYRRWAEHRDVGVRATICTIAAVYNYESLLEVMSLDEADPQLRQEIEAVLDEGVATTPQVPIESVRVPLRGEFSG